MFVAQVLFYRGTSFGAALHYRSVPMFLAAIADLALINIFNRCQDCHHKDNADHDEEKIEMKMLTMIRLGEYMD